MNSTNLLKMLDDAQKLKGHMQCTRDAYQQAARLFIEHIKGRSSFTAPDMRDYFLHLIDEHNFKARTVNLHQDAVRFLCVEVLKKPELMIGIKHMRINKTLPRIHDREDIRAMIDSTQNPKHRLLLTLCYGCGLRENELVHVRVCDFDWNRNSLRINDHAKGAKHRILNLPANIEPLFSAVCHGYGLMEYVFKGQISDMYSKRSAERVYVAACERVGVVPTGIHTLRHSFATHTLEDGCDLETLRILLGHESIKTVQIYLHVSKKHIQAVKSPLDKKEELPKLKLCDTRAA